MIPLVDLHRHLEGSIRPATCVELAARVGITKPPARWRMALVAAGREEGLLPYLAKIENATGLARTLKDWRRVTAEAVADAVSDTRLTREYKLAGDLLDEASLDIIKENALAARFTRPGGGIPSAGERF